MSIAALLISILALAFTISSFWWMNWRRGGLRVSGPRSFQAVGSEEGSLVVILPFLFYNDGAAPIIVENLRLLFASEKDETPLRFNALLERLVYEEKKRERRFATQFVVRGREARVVICEFQRRPGHLLFEANSYPMELQARLQNCEKWIRLHSCSLNVTENALPAINHQLLVHDNELV